MPPGQDRIATPIPAPGGLETVQAFLDTAGGKAGTDELQTPHDLTDFLSRRGLLPAGTSLSAGDLERARRGRRGLRSLLVANNGG